MIESPRNDLTDESAQPTDQQTELILKPWHRPQITRLEIRQTLFAGGSGDDGIAQDSTATP